jgi:thioredoxin-like negative regulator of GroEL
MAKSPSRSRTRDLAELLQQATTLHQRAQLADAERCYRQVLNAKRDHAEAQHYLGILRFQQGRGAEALELIGAALKSLAWCRMVVCRGLISIKSR